MIKKLIPIVLQAVFVFGGVAGGIYLKSSGMLGGAKAEAQTAEGDEHATSEGDGEGKKAEKKDKVKSKGGHGEAKGGEGGEGKDGASGDDKGVIKFSRQFVVPVIGDDGENSLVVFDIAIEVPPGASEGLYQFEPRLRDAVLSALLKLSNEGVFKGNFFDESNLRIMRSSLRDAAKTVIGEDAEQILILNIARQSS